MTTAGKAGTDPGSKNKHHIRQLLEYAGLESNVDESAGVGGVPAVQLSHSPTFAGSPSKVTNN